MKGIKIAAYVAEIIVAGSVVIEEEFYKLKYCSTVVYMVPRA